MKHMRILVLQTNDTLRCSQFLLRQVIWFNFLQAEIITFLLSIKLVPITSAAPIRKFTTCICVMIIVVSRNHGPAGSDLLGLVAVIYIDGRKKVWFVFPVYRKFWYFNTRDVLNEVQLTSCDIWDKDHVIIYNWLPRQQSRFSLFLALIRICLTYPHLRWLL